MLADATTSIQKCNFNRYQEVYIKFNLSSAKSLLTHRLRLKAISHRYVLI